jgi:epoxyqueuosine reductase
MDDILKEEVIRYMHHKVAVLGFSPVDRFKDAPVKHHPEDVCKDAHTVVVYGITIPRGVLSSPTYNLHTLHRSYHTIYKNLDDVSLDLCAFIESQGNYRAVPVPSYAPMVFQGMEPWGIISLKHAAVSAGLGTFGRSGQVYNPDYGSLLRFGAVVTSAALPGDLLMDSTPCPPKCSACHISCPSGAIGSSGEFIKLVCLGHTIKHAIYPLALKTEADLKHIERVINTAGYDYWIACDECVKVCPLNRKPIKEGQRKKGL